MKSRRSHQIGICLILLMAMFFLALPAGAHAASLAPPSSLHPLAGCSFTTCTGLDPQATGCSSDAVTKASAALTTDGGVGVGVVEIRYSPTCKAEWGRVRITYDGPAFSMVVRIHNDVSLEKDETSCNQSYSTNCWLVYSPMYPPDGTTDYAIGAIDSAHGYFANHGTAAW